MPLAQLDRLALFELEVGADGGVNPNEWDVRARDIFDFARDRKIPVDVAFALHGEARFDQLFGERRARERFADECSRWLGKSDAASGSLVDFWVAQVYDAHSVDAKRTGPLVTRARSNPVAIPRALARLAGLHVRRNAI